MITTSQIVDSILPLTKEDRNCGMKKAKKLRARANLIMLVNDYKEGKAVELPDIIALNQLFYLVATPLTGFEHNIIEEKIK